MNHKKVVETMCYKNKHKGNLLRVEKKRIIRECYSEAHEKWQHNNVIQELIWTHKEAENRKRNSKE